MINCAALMVKVKGALAVWTGEPESATLKVSWTLVAGVLGVPLIRPVAPFRLKPAVNCHMYAPVPPVAAKVSE